MDKCIYLCFIGSSLFYLEYILIDLVFIMMLRREEVVFICLFFCFRSIDLVIVMFLN